MKSVNQLANQESSRINIEITNHIINFKNLIEIQINFRISSEYYRLLYDRLNAVTAAEKTNSLRIDFCKK